MLEPNLLEVSDTVFKSNEAALGGAVFITTVEDKQAIYSKCVFEGNRTADGGAAFLNTGPGLDIFTESVFRSNSASESPRQSRLCVMELPDMVAICQDIVDRAG